MENIYIKEALMIKIDNLKNSIFAKAFVIILSASFILFWGIDGVFNSFLRGERYALHIGPKKISFREFEEKAAQNTQRLNFAKEDYSDENKLKELYRVTLNGLITDTLIDLEAKELKFRVGNDYIREYLSNNADKLGFKNGLNKDDLKRFLNHIGLTEQEFVDRLKLDLTRQYLMSAFSGINITIPEPMVTKYYEAYNHSRDIDVLEIPFSQISVSKPSEEDLNKTLKENKDQFMTEESKDVVVIKIDPSKINLEVDEAKLRNLYEKQRDNFKTPEVRMVNKLLVKNSTDIKKVEDLISNNKSLKDIASSLKNKVILSTSKFTYNDLPENLAKKIFSASNISVIKEGMSTQDGMVFYEVTQVIPAKESSFEEAKEELQKTLLENEGVKLQKKYIRNLKEQVTTGKSITDIIKKDGLASKSYKGLKPSSKTDLSEEVLNLINGLNNQKKFDSATSGDFIYVVVLENMSPSRLLTLEEARNQLEKIWEQKAKRKKSIRMIKEINDAYKKDKSLAKVASNPGYKLISLKNLKRNDKNNAEMIKQIFALPKGILGSNIGENKIQILELKNITTPKVNTSSKEYAEFKKDLQVQILYDIEDQYIEHLKAKFPVKTMLDAGTFVRMVKEM